MNRKLLKFTNEIKWLMATGIAVYLVLRAISIPITHDEAGSILNFATKSIFDIVTYQDPIPNNHILNTLLIKLLVGLFGLKEWVCRLPNLLAGIVFLYFSIKIMELIFSNSVGLQISAILLLWGNPFLMEFFALARGYGLAIGFMTASLYYVLRSNLRRDFTFALIFAALGVYANLTLLNYFVILCVGLFFHVLEGKTLNWKSIKTWVAVIGILLLALVVPVRKMVSTDQFHFWSGNGFYQDTFIPLIQSSLEGKKYFSDSTVLIFSYLVGLALLIIGFGTSYLVAKKGKQSIQLLSVKAAGLFLGTVFYNIFQNRLLDIPFLNARTALFFYPLFIISILAIWHDLKSILPRFVINAGIVLAGGFAAFHMVRSYNLHSAYEWWFDGDNKKVIKHLERHAEAEGADRIYHLKCNWLFQPSLTFYTKGQGRNFITPPPYNQAIDTSELVDFYYITSDDMNPWFKANYEIAQSYAWGARFLMKKKE